MKPSERIMEIFKSLPNREKYKNVTNYIKAMVDYLDEQWEKSNDESKEKT